VIQITNFLFEILHSQLMEKTARNEELINTLRSCGDIGENAPQYLADLQKLASNIRSKVEFLDNTNIFIALGNSDRLLLLQLLQQKDRCVFELEAALGKTQPAISRDLRILEQAQLIQGWKKGKFTHYSLNKSIFEKILAFSNEWVNAISNIISIERK